MKASCDTSNDAGFAWIVKGFGLHKRSPSSYAGLLAFGKEGKRLRREWELKIDSSPPLPCHSKHHMSKSGVIRSILIRIQTRTTFPLSFIFAALYGDDFQHYKNIPASLLFLCQLSCIVCGKLFYFCLSYVLYDHPVDLFDCIFSILLNTLSLHWLNEVYGLMHFQEQLSLWLPACVLIKWEKPKTLQLKWLLKFMKINAEGDLFCTALTSLYELNHICSNDLMNKFRLNLHTIICLFWFCLCFYTCVVNVTAQKAKI